MQKKKFKIPKWLAKTGLYIVSVSGVLFLGNGFIQMFVMRNFFGAMISLVLGILFTAFGIKRLALHMDPFNYVQ